jgi:hypothetical protein
LSQQPVEIESDHNEYAIDFISDAKVDNWPHRRGSYLQFLTHFVGYDVPECMLLEQVEDCKQLSAFLSSDVWAQFSQTQSYMLFKTRHPARDVDINKYCDIIDVSLKRGVLSREECSYTSILSIAEHHRTQLSFVRSENLQTLTNTLD